MMEHVRQFDWCTTSSTSGGYFVEESALDNCNTEKILRNKFFDPLLSSDDDDDNEPNVIDWDRVFKNRNMTRVFRIHVPGCRPVPPYPKLSVLTELQHFHCLKVLCAKNPQVLPQQFFQRPSFKDYKTLEALQEIYQKEQKEYIEWAKTQWVTQHCSRALRPKPAIESVYEAEFKVRAQRLKGFPTNFDMAAQIPMESIKGYKYNAEFRSTLIGVNIKDLPQIILPQLDKNVSIIGAYSLPEPCHKHPYQFVLPNERNVSILPITEIHRELANYAVENGTKFIASENALKCLVEFNRHWTLPISVCTALTPEGETCNVTVIDSEFSVHKEPAMMRTYRAYRHLLEHTLIPTTAREKLIEKHKTTKDTEQSNTTLNSMEDLDDLSDDEPLSLYIFEENDEKTDDTYLNEDKSKEEQNKKRLQEEDDNSCPAKRAAYNSMSMEDVNDIIGVYSCTCTDTLYERPPHRSYKKWRVINTNDNEAIDLLVHCAHKARDKSSELLLEPVPEYQLDLGGSDLPPDRIRAMLMSLLLRENADALHVRVDGSNGDIVTSDHVTAAQFQETYRDKRQQIVNVLHTTLSELQGLMPGHYVLQHEPSLGSNSFLLVSRPASTTPALQVQFDSTQLTEADEAKMVRAPPTISNVLLPLHKHRRILPCAFTPYQSQLAKEVKKPPAKQKPPPQAIKSQAGRQEQRTKWPKRNTRRNKRKH